jgi:diguanylate cyclase (GGDEF)-like protein
VGRPITVSIGLATLPDDPTDSATLLRNADRALYRAKSNGRNRVEATG